jgi:hypothetical protein
MFGEFIAFNKKGYRAFINHADPPPSAWSVGVNREEPSEGNVGGHAYVVAEQDDEAWLIDLAACEASRPARHIPVAPQVLNFKDRIDVFKWSGHGIACVWRVGSATLLYTSGTPDWTPPWEWDNVPSGFSVERNRPEIDEMIGYLDGGQLQS